MAVRVVLKMGDSRLLMRAAELETSEWGMLPALLEDMLDTMHALDGAGLAAPQIGVSKRVVIFGIGQNPRYPVAAPIPCTVLVNPQIEILDSQCENGWEGCLSVPGLRGLVPRYQAIRYRALDASGAELVREASGFHARVVQHECDHLDGVLYPMRIQNLRNFGFEDELFAESSTDPDAI